MRPPPVTAKIFTLGESSARSFASRARYGASPSPGTRTDPPRETTTRSMGTTACESAPAGNTFPPVPPSRGGYPCRKALYLRGPVRARDGRDALPVVREGDGSGVRRRGELRRGRAVDEAEDEVRDGRGTDREAGRPGEPVRPGVPVHELQAPPAVLLRATRLPSRISSMEKASLRSHPLVTGLCPRCKPRRRCPTWTSTGSAGRSRRSSGPRGAARSSSPCTSRRTVRSSTS